MHVRALIKSFIFLFLTYSFLGTTQAETLAPEQLDSDTKRYTISTKKSFEDVVDDIEFSISQNNYRITGRNMIGNAISKRTESPYPKSIIIHFCSLQAAKEIYDINPDFLLHMPCRISVREDSEKVLIEARLVPENDQKMRGTALRVNRMLRNIAKEGAN